jgi:acetylglutamate/LysW-gamma-L-alpha-aminoadipate kinase
MIILKIGGGATIELEHIADDLKGLEEPYIIVHGANAIRDELAQKLNCEIKRVSSISGYESVLSDKTVIDLQLMAYAGLQNKRIVELLQQRGINAIGLSGLDGAVIRGKRNPGIRVVENSKRKMLRDLSGKPIEINSSLLQLLLDNHYVPVLTVPIIDENGYAVNSENDDIVVLLQQALGANQVIHLIEAPGFLNDASNSASLIQSVTLKELKQWEQTSQGRFKRKLFAIKGLLENGAQEVIISDGRVDLPITKAKQGNVTIFRH